MASASAPSQTPAAGDSSASAPLHSARAKALGAFLRSRRELTTPESVGLVSMGRRRTPGLRREEIATLAGVGLAWYTWIEQGRVMASRQVLESIARSLKLGPTPTRHLFVLAGYVPEQLEDPDHDAYAGRASSLLDGWPTSPALVLDRYLDITAWNAAYAALWSDPGAVDPARRNLMWMLLGDPTYRELLVDWDALAHVVHAQLRIQAGPRTDDPRVQELDAVLRADFPEHERLWNCQGVGELTMRPISAALPGHGDLNLVFSAMRPVDDPDAIVLLQSPAGPNDHAAIARLVREAQVPVRRAA